jgi:hypothetical protein
MRPPEGTIDPESPYPLHQCTQCHKLAHTQKGTDKQGVTFYGMICDCEKAQPWKQITTRGWLRMMKKLYELRDEGIWTVEKDVPRDVCGTPLLDDNCNKKPPLYVTLDLS